MKYAINFIVSEEVYLYFEYKLNKSSEIALAQIEGRKHYEQFLGGGKQIAFVKINVSSKDKGLQVVQEILH